VTDQSFLAFVFEQIKQIKTDGGAPELSHLMAAVSAYKACDCDELAMKLAIWRWARMGETQSFDPPLSAQERLIYSAFRDAVILSGQTDLAASSDLKTDFHAEMLSSAA